MSSDALVFHYCWEDKLQDGYIERGSVVVLPDDHEGVAVMPVGTSKPVTGRILFREDELEEILAFLRKGNDVVDKTMSEAKKLILTNR